MESLRKRVEKLGLRESNPDVYGALIDVLTVLRMRNLSEEESQQVLDLISEKGRDEILDFPVLEDEHWQDFDYGNVKTGHYVRVKPWAYDSLSGMKHNSRVGRVVNISGRRVLVQYLGISGVSDIHHPIGMLQSPKYGLQWKTEKKITDKEKQ